MAWFGRPLYNTCYPSQNAKDVYVLQGDGRDFLSAVWTGVQGGTTGARDIQMTFKDDKEMCVSSTVLYSVGQYFQVMLDCGLRESQENKVILPTVTQSTFTRLVAFTLGQKVEIETREDVMELLEAAEMMQIPKLVNTCIERLLAQITADNCVFTFLMARRFQPDKVQMAASTVIRHIKMMKKSDEWCSLKEEDISILFKDWAVHSSYYYRTAFCEVFEALLGWMEANGADQDTSTRLLSLMDSYQKSSLRDFLPDLSSSVKNSSAMKAVQEWLKPEGEITLLVVGSTQSKGNDSTDTYIYCWCEQRQDWYIFPPHHKFPMDFAFMLTRHGNDLIVSGGTNETTGTSNKVLTHEEYGWRIMGTLATARSRHGMAIVNDKLYIVGGLPGPLTSVESMARRPSHVQSQEIGNLQEAVYDCGVAAVKDRLIVVGGCSSEGPRNIIQTFHIVSHAAEVITLPESPGLQLDTGFTRYLGTLDSLLFLSRSGHLLEVQVEGKVVILQSQILLKDFHHQSPFAAVLDSGGVVVCDSRSADCWYSLDGEKKEETTVVRRLKDNIQVHSVFRIFLPSKRSHQPRLGSKEFKANHQPRSRRERPVLFL